MRRFLRFFLGVYSPSRLSIGDPFELAIVWKNYRLGRVWWIAAVIGDEPDTLAWGLVAAYEEVRGLLAGFRDLTLPPATPR